MQKLRIEIDSWHWNLIRRETSTCFSDVYNSCDYAWAFLKAIISIFFKGIGVLVAVLLILFAAIPFLSCILVATLLFIPEMIYQAMYQESLYQILVVLQGDGWLWLKPVVYETWFTLGMFGMSVISIFVGAGMKYPVRGIISRLSNRLSLMQAPDSVQDIAHILKSKYHDKVCIPVQLIGRDGLPLKEYDYY